VKSRATSPRSGSFGDPTGEGRTSSIDASFLASAAILHARRNFSREGLLNPVEGSQLVRYAARACSLGAQTAR
jgi:hypothetical protein